MPGRTIRITTDATCTVQGRLDPEAGWVDLEADLSLAPALNGNTDWVYNYGPLARFMHKARAQRCGIISIENSNGYSNSGNAGGRVRAQRNAFAAAGLQAWGTHIMTMNGVWGASGYLVTTGLAPRYDDHTRDAPAATSTNWLFPSSVGDMYSLPVSVIHDWGRASDRTNVAPWNSTMAGVYSLGTAGVSTTANNAGGGVAMLPVTSGATGLIDWSHAMKAHM